MDTVSLINQTNAIVFLIRDGKIVYANKYANSFFGHDNLIGSDVMETIVPGTESSGRYLKNSIEKSEKNPGNII